MKCPVCHVPQLPDSNFCDECGAVLRVAETQPNASESQKATSSADTPGMMEIFSTRDVGELAVVRSYLESEGLRVHTPNYHAETMAMWSAGIARVFTLCVAEADVAEARKLLKDHIEGGSPTSESYRERLCMLALVATLVVFGILIVFFILNVIPG